MSFPRFQPDLLDIAKPQALSVVSCETREHPQCRCLRDESIESIQGQKGSNGLIRAISILRDAGLSEAESTVVMLELNNSGKAVPPWPLKELTRAISRNYAKARR